MSGIYIPGMEMPRTCDDCQVSADCPNDEHIDGYTMQERPRFCQLVPVPDHGRLIDADALEAKCTDEKGSYFSYEAAIIGEAVSSAPTIIPASTADKEGEGMTVEEWKKKNPPIRRKPKTNYDLIISKTPEELAQAIEEFSYEAAACPKDKCYLEPMSPYDSLDRNECKKCWLDWLKSPVEEGSREE